MAETEQVAQPTPEQHAAAFRIAANTLLERVQWMRQAGITFGGLRDIYSVLGYARVLTTQDYRDRYARGGLAGRAIDILPNATWRGEGEVIEDDDPKTMTKFEQSFADLNERVGIWPTCLRADKLASIGGFSAILIGAPGVLESELPKGRPETLAYLMPFAGGVINDTRGQSGSSGADVTIHSWETDSKSPRFGKPNMYQLRRTNMTAPSLMQPVHWTRIVHVPAEGFLDDAVFGPPKLERIWNHLDELDKVSGGGSEAFWLRANQGTLINIDKDMKLPAGDNTVAALQEQVDNFSNQMTRVIRGKGVNIEQFGSDVADFKNPVDCLTTLIAACLGVPKRILMGSEMGELASTQDRENWQDQINDRRTSYARPIVLKPLIDRLSTFGYMAAPAAKDWKPGWANVINLSETEKADGAKKWTDINKMQGEVVFTSDEIRDTWYGKDPLTEEERQTFGTVEKADHLSVNDKRALTGQDEYTGDPDVDDIANVPLALLPKAASPIAPADGSKSGDTTIDTPATPGTPLAVAATARRLETALERGGTVHLVVSK